MANRATSGLLPERKQALRAELRILAALERRAELDKLVHVARSYEAGLSLEEIAEDLEVSKNTAHRWKNEGQRERERRRRGDQVSP